MLSFIEEFIHVSLQGDDVYIKISKPWMDAGLPSYGKLTGFIREV